MSHTYQDILGLPTIGYGHRLLPEETFPEGVSDSEATNLLAADVHTAELAVHRLVKVLLTQGQFDALVDFVYNLGAGRLAGSTLLKELNNESYEAAAAELLRWDHAGAREVEALEARRAAEFELWNKPGASSVQAA